MLGSKKLEAAMNNVVEIYRQEEGYNESEPMDSDEVERLAKLFYVYADFGQGNLTWQEYQEKLLKVERQ